MQLDDIKQALLASYRSDGGINHVDGPNLPSQASVNQLAADCMHLLFPGYFEESGLTERALPAHVGKLLVIGREFMADASHELRTPVAAIQGYSETLMAGGVDGPTGKQFVETIHHHAVRLGRLVQDMLQLSALEARAADKLVKEPVDLRGVAELVAETLEAPATARRATLTVSGGAEVLAVGDPGAVEQILENLVQNAIKYGREGGAVEVRVERGEGVARVIVADDGAGIAPEHLPRLFERFYRVDAGRSRDRGGTGLGLAIVKELASVMGGTVAVESEVGKGTTFTVELPLA